MKQQTNAEVALQQGVWSMFGTYALILILAYCLAPVQEVANEFWHFLTGGVQSLPESDGNLVQLLPRLLMIVGIDLPVAILSLIIVTALLGKGGKNAVDGLFKDCKEPKNIFYVTFLLVVAEELFARWLFLGVLTRIPFLSGTVGFYLLMLLGNSLWALMHLSNYKEEDQRHWLRVAPQFVGGIFLSYVYVRHGLMAAILAHFASNAVLFSAGKTQSIRGSDLWRAIVITGVCLGCYYFMSKPLSAIVVWFDKSSTSFALEGWEVWDYLLAYVFYTSITHNVFTLLMYDRPNSKSKKEGLLPILFGILAILGIIYSLDWVMRFFIATMSYRMFAITLAICFMAKSKSLSGAMRLFWSSFTSSYLFLGCIYALSFANAIIFIMGVVVTQEVVCLLANDNNNEDEAS